MEYEIARVLASFLCGFLLALSGSLVQQITQNSLAGPSTLGMNSLVVLVILGNYLIGEALGFEESNITAFIVYLGIVFFLYTISNKRKANLAIGADFDQGVRTLLLMGLCFNLFVGAMFSIAHFFYLAQGKPFPTELWFGNFRQVTGVQVYLLIGFALVLSTFACRMGNALRALSFGIETSLTLGVDVRKTIRHSLIISCLAVGLVTCFFGVFAFMGLIIPHVLRQFRWFRQNSARELSWGALASGLFLMALDQACYHLTFEGTEMPVGLLSSVFGSFILMFLMLRSEKHLWRLS